MNKNHIHKQNIFIQAMGATFFCLVLMILFNISFGGLFEKVEKLSPGSNKMESFQLSDLCFAYTHANVATDPHIVIINCARDDRKAIAAKIKTIASFSPRVIGVDIVFAGSPETGNDTILTGVINEAAVKCPLVLSCNYGQNTMDLPFYKLLQTRNINGIKYKKGYLTPESSIATRRNFNAFIGDTSESIKPSFEFELLNSFYEKAAYDNIVRDSAAFNIINYRKTLTGLPRYDIYSNIPDSIAAFKDKIVLIGTCDSNFCADKVYTPLNDHLGRSLPDMYGVEYHAQILSMIMNHDVLHELPFKYGYIFIMCYLFMLVYFKLHHRYPELLHYFIDIILILIVIPLLTLLACVLLERFHTRLEPVDFLVPMFACGFLFPFYTWVSKRQVLKKCYQRYKRRLSGQKKTALLYLVLAMLLLSPIATTAKTKRIYIAEVSGKVSFQDGKMWQPINGPMQTYDDMVIKVQEGSAVYLTRDDSHCLVKANKTIIAQLSDLTFQKDQSVVEKLISAAFHGLFDPAEMKTASSVKSGSLYQMLLPADGETLLYPKVRFEWLNTKTDQDILYVTSGTGSNKWMVQKQLPNRLLLCDGTSLFPEGRIMPFKQYSWSLIPKEHLESQSYFISFSMATTDRIDSLNRDLKLIESDTGRRSFQTKMLVTAVCYESYHMYSEASKIYYALLKKEPRVILNQIAYDNFRNRIQMINQP